MEIRHRRHLKIDRVGQAVSNRSLRDGVDGARAGIWF